MDEVFERASWSIMASRKLLMTVGKAGILWKLDPTNGKF